MVEIRNTIRSIPRKIALVLIIFAISYIINAWLVFTEDPTPFGQMTGLFITAIACVIAFALLYFSRSG